MGNQQCCAAKDSEYDRKTTTGDQELRSADAMPVSESGALAPKSAPPVSVNPPPVAESGTYTVKLDKAGGGKLGLDVDFMAERRLLPIMSITGGLAEDWNRKAPADQQLRKGDSVVEVNGLRGNTTVMLDRCKTETSLTLVLAKAMTYDNLISDLEALINTKNCGPILIRLSWHDAGVFMQGKGGCPNAAMRFAEGGEGTWPENAGLTTVALALLGPITKKYVPELISNADLWALAANVATRLMGGPDVPTRFGREDAKAHSAGVARNEGRLPDADKAADHLRAIFTPKGFDDRAIVALSGAHTVGRCHVERSGFDGAWTENPLKFDNGYFKELMSKSFTAEQSSAGKTQHRCPKSKTIMLNSDLALLEDAGFKKHVEEYANDVAAFFADYTKAWVKLQENGVDGMLRDVL